MEYLVYFCDKYANVATILVAIITILGAFGIKKFAQKCKEKKELYNEFLSPVRKRSASEQINACINASDNGVSEIEVEENE